jgi:hypothetical protein
VSSRLSGDVPIEYFDRARVQPACARAGELLALTPLEDGDIDPRQRELTCQHQPRRPSADDDDRMEFLHASLIANLVDRWKLVSYGDS